MMSSAQRALLHALRELFADAPRIAVDAGGHPLRFSRTMPAVEARADDGPALVAYIRAKIHEPAGSGYDALVAAGHPERTFEAMVADMRAPWASEFSDADRRVARKRLDARVIAYREHLDVEEAAAVDRDRAIVEQVSANRVAKGRPPLTAEQRAEMLEGMAARRRQQEARR